MIRLFDEGSQHVSHRMPLSLASALIALIWTATIGGFLAWDIKVAQEHAEQLARNEARLHFNKDLTFRRWATSHGGVYVPIDERTQPNPGLAHVPERDIETPSGRKLTLMNPAYMMRQVMNDFGEQYGAKGKLTSLKLINPTNAPDDWEKAALLRFEQGEREIAEFADIGGQPYLRQIGALMVEKGCLKCHGSQGYKEGEVRGGISISVPVQPYLDDMYRNVRKLLLPLGAIWLLGMLLIVLLVWQVRRRFREHQASEEALRKSTAQTVSAHADLKRFADIAAHHLMEPTRRLASYTQLLKRSMDAHPEAKADKEMQESMQYLEGDAAKLRDLVRDIQLYLAAGQPRGEVRLEDADQALAKVELILASQLRSVHARVAAAPLPPAMIDRHRLVDLFTILVENAARYGRPRHGGRDLQIAVSGERDGSLSRYRVSDNGPGIPPEYRERVFDIFETLQGAGQGGTGVGLSIARRIVESRHGRIWIEESAQGGATVVFELPDGE